ncbi:ABC transporter ATP-binding protein [Tropicibacter naphthalenivorans]|uniref:LIV-I protein F n=1 Tax=Tropicibacter naphthalenivorans TaxID=441103 RepID=A0A0N7M149_9RHOB|nr:ATP-binding cassette domain-containing protein [Tropicibacter naphthalenivorans]CUH82273.1 LIV-I protein F [Tropicibacter naphthalenivorans]SMD04653.1 amino acid/amide ABC transporter ATP-binding protein 2, HAAT family [Tropicibacter naphthalenivorans]
MTLTIENLTVQQGGRAVVSEASLAVAPGKVTAVLGANGAGKSELALAIGGMLPVASGAVRADGRDLAGLAPNAVRAAGVAVVPEGHRVLTLLSVDDNLRAAASLLSTSEVEETLERTYTLFPELAERKKQIAGTMSGGQQQMLAIGHALMCRPQYLVIDEMSLGLAPLIVKRLVSAIGQLVADGAGIIIVEQFTEVALSMVDDAIVMRGGAVRYSGSAQALKDDPSLLDQAYF